MERLHLLGGPSLNVALLEGGTCGHGPSGRNGGFCESLWFSAAAIRSASAMAPRASCFGARASACR